MVKKMLMLLTFFCFAFSSACAESPPETLLEKTVRIAEDGETLIPMSEMDLYDIIGIEPDTYTDFAYLAEQDALSGREIILLRARNEEAARILAEMLKAYREQRLEMTRNYLPEAFRAISEAEVTQKDLLVLLSIAAPDPREPELLLAEE